MPRKPKASSDKNKKKPKTQPVVTRRLPVIKCSERRCSWSRAILPGQDASKLLTEHYRDKHA